MNDLADERILARLEDPEGLKGALAEILRLTAYRTNAAACALASGSESPSKGPWWIIHDPDGVIDGGRTPKARSRTRESKGLEYEESHRPIRLDGRTVATLGLWHNVAVDREGREECPGAYGGLLALLAVANASVEAIDGLLDPAAYRALIVSEISRGERTGQGFSTIDFELLPASDAPRQTPQDSWTFTRQLAGFVRSWLRKSDAVAVADSYRLAVLLAPSTPVAVKIAERRIRQRLEQVSQESSFPVPVVVEPHVLSFPTDGTDADEFWMHKEQRASTHEPALWMEGAKL